MNQSSPVPVAPIEGLLHIALLLAVVCVQDRDESPFGWSELPPPTATPEGMYP
ncbi:hypothetical protein [Streptomyces sp. ITFR-6]|uniref:hypothetical protein n=1 Tax=Streptomyces sp. ITFR-6 TaxID=3075197 RepID=UPI00288A322C|nr:hypothetical protein [Streptomyces sp. ITFR-6]WNI31475.1 hypothetical protein RLT59_23800 [Streptomyces sp. ITFR-6]